jgi:hypothetical protein
MSLSTHPLHLEITSFIDGLKVKKPTWKPSSAGRAIWWDKNLNSADQVDYGEAWRSRPILWHQRAPERRLTSRMAPSAGSPPAEASLFSMAASP